MRAPALGLLVGLAGLATPGPAPAQSAGDGSDPPVRLQRLAGPVVLDGVPDEAAWAGVEPLPLTMYFPTFRGDPAERSEIRVAYDDEALWVAGRFYDADPEGIRVNSLYRDRWSGDDALAIYVDAFNDNQNAKWFGTNPAAMRFDLLVSDDGATLNDSWNGFWDARTTITGEGWFAEVRIPFSTLGFQAEDGRAVMGLTVTRLVSRTGERVTFPAIAPRFQFRQPSVAQDVVLEDVTTARPVYVTPYVLSGLGRRHVPDPEGGVQLDEDTPREAGLDVRYALSSTLTLDVTANTDFAQVEADEEQVKLDRFDLFFPEKRRFFQEGSGVFDFGTGAGSRLFHSRRIGLDANRAPVPVLGGARLVGRAGPWDVGLLAMQTDDVAGTPSETFGVARLRHGVVNPWSWVGGLVTTRLSRGSHNVAGGVDGVFRLFGDDWLTVRAAASADDMDGAGGREPDPLDRSHLYVQWARRTNRGLSYDLRWVRSGVDYRPETGFLPRRDFTQLWALANWYLFRDGTSSYRRVWPGALAFSTFRNGDGALESGQYAVWLQWETKAGGGGWIEPKLFVEDVLAPFAITRDAEVPAGRHVYADLQLALSMPAGRTLRADLDARAGTYFDGTRIQAIVTPTWNASRHLELGGRWQYTRLDFSERGQSADIHVGGLLVRSALDARASANAFVQYNSTTDRLDLNLRLRYNFSEGTDLWLVYDEGLPTDRLPDPAGPRLPFSMARTLIVKYSHTFTM